MFCYGAASLTQACSKALKIHGNTLSWLLQSLDQFYSLAKEGLAALKPSWVLPNGMWLCQNLWWYLEMRKFSTKRNLTKFFCLQKRGGECYKTPEMPPVVPPALQQWLKNTLPTVIQHSAVMSNWIKLLKDNDSWLAWYAEQAERQFNLNM